MVVLDSQYDDGKNFAKINPSICPSRDRIVVNFKDQPFVCGNIHRKLLIQVFTKLMTARWAIG